MLADLAELAVLAGLAGLVVLAGESATGRECVVRLDLAENQKPRVVDPTSTASLASVQAQHYRHLHLRFCVIEKQERALKTVIMGSALS
jgi:hypothetical protein